MFFLEFLWIRIEDFELLLDLMVLFFFFINVFCGVEYFVEEEKGEIIKFSDDLEFLIFVYKSFEEDVFLSCVLDD